MASFLAANDGRTLRAVAGLSITLDAAAQPASVV